MMAPTGLACGGMMGGFGGWLMMGTGVLFLGLVVLGIAALVKYLFWRGPTMPPA